MEFTREEISKIEKNLNFIVFDWAKHLINHIITQARNKGVNVVYLNTSETLEAGGVTDPKVKYFYEKLPPLLGFKLEKVNLRGRGEELLWAYHLDQSGIQASLLNSLLKFAKSYPLEELPRKYQGAFIGIIGRKPYYDENDVQKVLSILEKKNKKPKSTSKFYYDWDSKTWSGGQRFSPNVTENVVMQKITSDIQNLMQQDPALLKFWSLILSQTQHFGPDVIGFALVSKISPQAWVINEIQTDAINAYLELRRLDKQKEEGEQDESITFETLKDMLEAQNRSKWIPKVETNEAFKNQLMQNPQMIQQLPDDTNDIDKWIAEQLGQTEMQDDLMQHFESIDFNTRIFKRY